MLLAMVAVLLGLGAARGAEYATAFKDRAKATRTYHAEVGYRFEGVVSFADGKPVRAGGALDLQWDAREKVLSASKDGIALSYEVLAGTEKGEALGELADMSPDDAKFEEKMDPLTVTYTRAASGAASAVKCTKGELPFIAGEDEMIGALGEFFALGYPFGQELVFPAATAQDGDTWSEDIVVKLPAPSPTDAGETFPVTVTRQYTVDGARQIDGLTLLQVTCTLSGKRGPGLQEWEMQGGETVAAIIGGSVTGKITYLFDPAAGALYRVTAQLTASLDIKQEGRSAQLNETLTTRMEQVKKAK